MAHTERPSSNRCCARRGKRRRQTPSEMDVPFIVRELIGQHGFRPSRPLTTRSLVWQVLEAEVIVDLQTNQWRGSRTNAGPITPANNGGAR